MILKQLFFLLWKLIDTYAKLAEDPALFLAAIG